jgi:hypothetical protein
MKELLANKLMLAIIGSVVVVGVGAGVYFGVLDKNKTETRTGKEQTENKSSNNDFIRTGQNSFGLEVCNEMTKEKVGEVIGKTIVNIKDYSNGGSTGCEYFITDTSFVIIDVGYGDMAKQKQGLEFLDRTLKTDNRIKLENMLAYSEKGLIDVYMNVAPGQKYVRVGRSSTTAVNEETLIKLAIATEAKIRSYK